MNKKSVNIESSSSGKGLKEDIAKFAAKRFVRPSNVIIQIYEFAVQNPRAFPNSLEEPLPKYGKSIGVKVDAHIANSLKETANALGRSRSAHCCFLLECVLAEKKLQDQIFGL